jgi:hypothetical protein
MAITKQEVLDELKSLMEASGTANRRLLALTMRVQNMPDAAFHGQATELAVKMGQGEMVVDADRITLNAPEVNILATAPHPNDGVLDRDGKTTQPSIFIPQMNTQETIDAARRATGNQIAETLASAKSLLKTAMRNAGHTEAAIDLVDQVGIEHLATKAPDQQADYVVPAEDRTFQSPVEVSAEQVEAEVAQGILSAFIGKGSIFMESLDHSMMFGARGTIKPDGDTIKRYGNDARWTSEANLRLWPTSFYLDKDSKQLQFLVNSDQCAVLLTALPSEVSPVLVYFYGTTDGWKDIAAFLPSEQKLIHAKVEDVLSGLKKK